MKPVDLCAPTDDRASSAGEEHRAGSRRGLFRLLVRVGFLAAMVLVLAGWVPWAWASLVVPAFSPYVTIGSTLARQTHAYGSPQGLGGWAFGWSWAQVVGLVVLILVLVRHRWFCRYACPVGLLSEPLRRVRPNARVSLARLPNLGRWLCLATTASAVLGYPLVLWFDPLAMVSGAFSLTRDVARGAGWVAAGALLLVAIAAVVWPNAWCLRVCPLGATQELLSLLVRTIGRSRRTASCATSESGGKGSRFARRQILSVTSGLFAAGIGAALGLRFRSTASEVESRVIRPPGARAEDQFPWLCLRCGNCLRACPEGILHPDQTPDPVFGFLTPLVRFSDKYCLEDCCRCTEVCPSGAITAISVEEKPRWPIGLAHVDRSLCLLSPENGERECAVCRNACPYQAIKIDFDYDTYVSTPRVDVQKCPGCGACEAACPGTNETQRVQASQPLPLRKAIFVMPRSHSGTPQRG